MVNQIITIAFFCNSIQLKTICCFVFFSFNFLLNNLFQRSTLAGPSNLWVEILFWKLCKLLVSYMAAVSREKLTNQPSGIRTQVKVDVKRRSSRKKKQKNRRVPTQRRPPEWDPDLWDPWTNNNTRLRRPRPLSKPHSLECLFPFSPKHFPWPDACLRSDGRTACQADPSSLTVSSWRLIEHKTGTDRKR